MIFPVFLWNTVKSGCIVILLPWWFTCKGRSYLYRNISSRASAFAMISSDFDLTISPWSVSKRSDSGYFWFTSYASFSQSSNNKSASFMNGDSIFCIVSRRCIETALIISYWYVCCIFLRICTFFSSVGRIFAKYFLCAKACICFRFFFGKYCSITFPSCSADLL